jgi:hypothetical protein
MSGWSVQTPRGASKPEQGHATVLRWPFWGGLLALAVDQSDLFMMNLLRLGGVGDYQTFDKYLDQAYLLAFSARGDLPTRSDESGFPIKSQRRRLNSNASKMR